MLFRSKEGQEGFEGTYKASILFNVYDASGRGTALGPPGAVIHVGISIKIPANDAEVLVFTFEQMFTEGDIIEHLEQNALHYSTAIWRSLDAATITTLLSSYTFENRQLIEVIDPVPISVSGNYVVFRLYGGEDSEEWQEFLSRHDLLAPLPEEDLIPLPSSGVFAEAVLGRSNSAEKLDLSRFWNWQDSPIPILPPEINPLTAGGKADDATPQTGNLESPVVNIQNAPSLPDPAGLAPLYAAIANGNMFRDMSGLAQVAALAGTTMGSAQAGAGQAMTAAGSAQQVAANLFRDVLEIAVQAALATAGKPPMGGLGGGGSTGGASALPQTPTNLGAVLGAAKELDEAEAAASDPSEWAPFPGESSGDGEGPLSPPPLVDAPGGTAKKSVPPVHESAILHGTKPTLQETSIKSASDTLDLDADEIAWALQNPGMLERMVINGRQSADHWALWNFAVGNSDIDRFEERLLANRAEWESWRNNGDHVEIIGFASVSGSEKANERLALERAHAVRQWLVDEIGIPGENLTAYGGGVSNDLTKGPIFNPQTRAWNRRVELRRTGRPLEATDWDRLSKTVDNTVVAPGDPEADKKVKSRLQCLINSLRDQKKDDTYLPFGQQFLEAKALIQHPNYDWWIRNTDNWHKPRFGLKLLFSLRARARMSLRPGFSDGDLMKGILSLDAEIEAGRAMIAREIGATTEGKDVHVVTRLAKDWLATKQKDPNSVYYCYRFS